MSKTRFVYAAPTRAPAVAFTLLLYVSLVQDIFLKIKILTKRVFCFE